MLRPPLILCLPTVQCTSVQYIERYSLCSVLRCCIAFCPFVRETMTPGRVMANKSSKHHRTAPSALGRRSTVLAAAATGALCFGGLPAANAEINHYNGMELPVSCCCCLFLCCLGLLSRRCGASRSAAYPERFGVPSLPAVLADCTPLCVYTAGCL